MKVVLKCLNASHENILLNDGISKTLGRSEETKIQDKRCSRKQVELTANYAERFIIVKQLGSNSSYVDTCEVKKGETVKLKQDQVIYFVGKEFPHQMLIEEYNQQELADNKSVKKRTIGDYFGDDGTRLKKLKVNNNESDGPDDSTSILEKLQKLQNHTGTSSGADAHPQTSARKHGWYEADRGLLVYETEDLRPSKDIVAFDMDNTLITTKSGKTFATDCNDWKILFSEIPGKLKKLNQTGYKLVIITNQLGVGKGKVKESDFKEKVENIIKVLGVPFQVLAITERGKYRKPNTGSYTWISEQGNGGTVIDSFVYVGDAAGRPKNWSPGKKKDFSCSDRLFAINLKTDFHTPEEYFLNQKPAKYDLPEFNPNSLGDRPLTDGADISSKDQEVIVLVGYPASGKSTFAKTHLEGKGYVIVNRDTLKTWQRCLAACDAALTAGKSVVVDNTNPDLESRQRYVNCAKKHKCPCRCFVMSASIDHAMHNNRFRELTGSKHDVVPRMILYSYRKKFVEPKSSEGFSEIVKINFVPNFKDETFKQMYFMYND